MKHKVSELEGDLLDLAAAKASDLASIPGQPVGFFYWGRAESGWFTPSTNWEHAGPIIARGRISLDAGDDAADWTAYAPMAIKLGIASADGSTPLIAAMRAFCASRFGDEVELP